MNNKRSQNPLAVRVSGQGFRFAIRSMVDEVLRRRRQRRALDELNSLSPEIQRDIGWPVRATHENR
ncbi:hypothetical protein LXM94_11075 [Rhizobium sp. TRM95111]|uniref:hypothetical protein n=1 Tax=Rhizobium alarense TaxID=2846851 RepID=UPI001F193ED3|nr:hypothetical protein [Rhizobium alarense]MCF3640505.1 hypothetical protein [Rhizobium alarense]